MDRAATVGSRLLRDDVDDVSREMSSRQAMLADTAAATITKATGSSLRAASMGRLTNAEEALRAWIGVNYLKRLLGSPANQTVRPNMTSPLPTMNAPLPLILYLYYPWIYYEGGGGSVQVDAWMHRIYDMPCRATGACGVA